MKNTTTIIIGIVLLVVGIFIGKLFFSKADNSETKQTEEVTKVEHWTCSMHPQIDLPEPGDCPICGMDLIPMDETGRNANPLVFEMTEDAIKLANIQTIKVGSATATSGGVLRLSGKIQADESKSASLVSHIPGRIEQLYVSFTGETVRRGQKMARLYSPDLITAQKELLESKMMENVNPKLFEATLNKLKYWKITDKQIENILESKEIQESFVIYAEHSGIVSKRRVSVGDHLKEGGILFDTQNLDNLWVLFDVYEENLATIKLGDEIKFTTPAVPGKEFRGKITFINPVIDPKTRAASVRVEIRNKNQELKPEMFVTGEALIKSSSDTRLSVPKSAVLWTGVRSVVYVKVPNTSIPSFEFREVVLGDAVGDNYQIIEGLAPGEEVVVHGGFVIDASAQLNNQASMMNRLVKGGETTSQLPDYTSTTPREFKSQLENLDKIYLELKNALVNDDAAQAQQHAAALSAAVPTVDMTLLQGDAHLYWMKKMKAIKEKANEIEASSEIETQRKHFDQLSKNIIESTKVFGVDNEAFYVDFCPMASEGKGAYWLSEDLIIRNPYFGAQMMECGEVKDTLDQNFRNPVMKMNTINSPKQGHKHE